MGKLAFPFFPAMLVQLEASYSLANQRRLIGVERTPKHIRHQFIQWPREHHGREGVLHCLHVRRIRGIISNITPRVTQAQRGQVHFQPVTNQYFPLDQISNFAARRVKAQRGCHGQQFSCDTGMFRSIIINRFGRHFHKGIQHNLVLPIHQRHAAHRMVLAGGSGSHHTASQGQIQISLFHGSIMTSSARAVAVLRSRPAATRLLLLSSRSVCPTGRWPVRVRSSGGFLGAPSPALTFGASIRVTSAPNATSGSYTTTDSTRRRWLHPPVFIRVQPRHNLLRARCLRECDTQHCC
mmetsp:Transcript_11694/g.28390  ORF Transcript_11694/g.28390 Transcript_11694/m.28390 type:complete len:295 (-) Transcript_11694:135-1019(-)